LASEKILTAENAERAEILGRSRFLGDLGVLGG